MKTIRSFLLFGAGLVLSFNLLLAQTAVFPSVNARLDSVTDLRTMLEAVESVQPVSFNATLKQQKSGTFWSAQFAPGSRTAWPPLPGNILQLDFWPLGDGQFILDDRKVDCVALAEEATSQSSSLMAKGAFSPAGFGGGGFSPLLYSTNVLWLEITSVDMTNQLADLLLHHTEDVHFYQLLSKTNLVQSGGWTLGEIITGDSGTNQTVFSPVNIASSLSGLLVERFLIIV